jgi:hypothetical protein
MHDFDDYPHIVAARRGRSAEDIPS